MGLKDRLAESRERARKEKEAYEANLRAELARRQKEVDAEYLRRSQMYDLLGRAGSVNRFPALGVQVPAGGDTVYTTGFSDHFNKRDDSRPLGPLVGAAAQVTDGTSAFSWGKAALMPLATAPLARKETADALITFSDGTVHKVALDGSQALRAARAQCVEFNALAGMAAPAPAAAQENGDDPASRLRKLRELLDAGLVSQEEHDARRTAIIESI